MPPHMKSTVIYDISKHFPSCAHHKFFRPVKATDLKKKNPEDTAPPEQIDVNLEMLIRFKLNEKQ